MATALPLLCSAWMGISKEPCSDFFADFSYASSNRWVINDPAITAFEKSQSDLILENDLYQYRRL